MVLPSYDENPALSKILRHARFGNSEGVCTNQAESFLSSLCRMIGGQPSQGFWQASARLCGTSAWLGDHRRLDNGTPAHRALRLSLAHNPSTVWAGYFQRNEKAA
jgi:hypothetical protein